jgi:hypothetical protein
MADKYDYVCDPDGVVYKTGQNAGKYITYFGQAMHRWVAEMYELDIDFWTIQDWTSLSPEYLVAIGRWHGFSRKWGVENEPERAADRRLKLQKAAAGRQRNRGRFV